MAVAYYHLSQPHSLTLKARAIVSGMIYDDVRERVADGCLFTVLDRQPDGWYRIGIDLLDHYDVSSEGDI